ncbi:hypothetical protein [Abyssicoccus albus]|uniref:hypothetical protein n=1 Tax=Abyssicoccus albus TaxID=1817405 RepID=UPI0039EE4C18
MITIEFSPEVVQSIGEYEFIDIYTSSDLRDVLKEQKKENPNVLNTELMNEFVTCGYDGNGNAYYYRRH